MLLEEGEEEEEEEEEESSVNQKDRRASACERTLQGHCQCHASDLSRRNRQLALDHNVGVLVGRGSWRQGGRARERPGGGGRGLMRIEREER